MATSVIKPLGIVIPTRWEAAEVLRRFAFRKISTALYKTDFHGRSIWLCLSGVGRAAARVAAARLVAEGAGDLVSMGFCGALIPELRVGDLVTDRIATVDKPARSMDERRTITERANAVAVDMETQAIIEEGTRRGVPIHVLRVVSDQFDDDLRLLIGPRGTFFWWNIAMHLLYPRSWPLAWRMYRQSRFAQICLGDAFQNSLPSSSC